MDLTRRRFLEATAIGAVVAPSLGAAAGKLPTRAFGRRGLRSR